MGVKIILLNRFYAPDHSATSQILTDLAGALFRNGEKVYVLTSRQRYQEPRAQLTAFEEIDGVQVHRVWTSRFGRGNPLGRAVDYLTFYISATIRLFSLAERGDVVIVKTDPPMLSVPVSIAVRLRGAKSVNWLQDIFPEVAAALGHASARGFVGTFMRRMRNNSLKAAHRNVAIGNRMKDWLVAEGIGAERIEVIPNWADGASIQPIAPDHNPLREQWSLTGKFVVGYSGNMGRAHEFDTILGAAEQLREHIDIVFLFVGSGAQREGVENTARDRGLSSFMFKPYEPREMLAQSLSAADVHLVSLRPELEAYVVPSKIYGIAAAGRPTIFVGDDNGEIATLLRDSESGLSVRPGDVAGLAAAIARLHSDRRLGALMGQSARRMLLACYDKPIGTDRWCRMVKQMTKE